MNWYKKASFNDELSQALKLNLGEEKGGDLFADIDREIKNIGIEYRFEDISAGGMAKNDVCIISKNVLGFNIPNMIFVLFHELAHYHQYKKYGKDFAMSLYTNPISEIDSDINFLKEIESTASRFSKLKTSFYINKHKINNANITADGYSFISDGYLRQHLIKIKEEIKKRNYTTIEEINEYIYNSIKRY